MNNFFALCLSVSLLFTRPQITDMNTYKPINQSTDRIITERYLPILEGHNVEEEPIIEEPIVEEVFIDESLYSDYEIYLLALVSLAEAEGEPEYGRRLVISTILNRLDSEYYPDDIYNVIYQPYQFEAMMNGRVDRVVVTDEAINLVHEEIANRSNYDVIYFKTDNYSEYGTPLFQYGDHYFSSF